MTIDVYRQYFEAECTFAGVPRRAALVTLTSDSEAGRIRPGCEGVLGQAAA